MSANSHNQLTEVMRGVELFRGLSPEQLARLALISRRETYKEGETVFAQDSIGDKMYIVVQGQVAIVVRGSSGEDYPALYLGEGQVFGEMALVDDGKRSATVRGAQENTVVYAIPNTDFTALCRTDTGIGYVMMRNIAQDLSFKLRHRVMDSATSM
jgi:CRP/FNR family transcriptional regulator, cyclic AMP receptor protein